MKAMRFHEYGDPSVLVFETAPRPVPRQGEVLIKVAATSFNPSEIALRSGHLKDVLPLDMPYIPGWDVSGTIVEAPAGSAFRTGDAVLGRLDAGGAAAEYVTAPASILVHAPLIRPGGVVVSIATPIEPDTASGVTGLHMVARNDPAQLARLVAAVDAGTLDLGITETRPLADLELVHRASEAGQTHGKTIITL